MPSCAKSGQLAKRAATREIPLALWCWPRYDVGVRCYISDRPGLPVVLRNHAVAVSLVFAVSAILRYPTWADQEPQLHATLINESHEAREFIVGPAQSPMRQRFWLAPGEARTVQYPFIGATHLAIAELRAGTLQWETRAGYWSEGRGATVQKFGIAADGQVLTVAAQELPSF